MSRKPKQVKVLLDQLTDNKHVLKGSYGSYYVYRKDWLFDHLEDEFALLESVRNMKKLKNEAKKINKTPFSTKINEDLGILGN